MKVKANSAQQNATKQVRRRRVRLWGVLTVIIICAAGAWVLYDAGIIKMPQKFAPALVAAEIVEPQPALIANNDTAPIKIANIADSQTASVAKDETVVANAEQAIRPACAVIEDILLQYIADDSNDDYSFQEYSAQTYFVLAERGCPENAQLFRDLGVRKQAIADGLRAYQNALDPETSDNNSSMTSAEYLYSDEKICQTIENRVLKNIDTNAFTYKDFLHNANTYATLFQYGCKDNKLAYSRAAVRELGVAVALMPTDHMEQGEIVMVVEICKSLGVAEIAHFMVQRLKARGYDMEFLLSLEDIIHGIR